MSSKPEDFIDPEFWGWYREDGPKWLLRHRLDIINAMYEAYEDELDEGPVMMRPGAPFFFMGTNEELEDFTQAIQSILAPFKNPPPNKNKSAPISSYEINKLKQNLNNLKFKYKGGSDENSKGNKQS